MNTQIKAPRIVHAINICLVVILASFMVVSCLTTARLGVDGTLTTPTDTIRLSDHPKTSVTFTISRQ